jgi:exopolyphosphatase / guanosine-5'-triphosphate,3'-diphosphate pyrophosphatase
MRRRAAIDIGTNSVRLLVVDEHGADLTRRSEVTGLGRGLSASGRLNAEGRSATLEVLGAYAEAMAGLQVERQRAVMTAAGRNATDTTDFLTDAAEVLGFPIDVIPGEEEAALSYAGAASDLPGDDPVVVDIGGGSTEIVTAGGGRSFEIGSVRLTDQHLADRPVPDQTLADARATVRDVLAPVTPTSQPVVGVAGTWTTLAAIEHGVCAPDLIHHSRLSVPVLGRWIDRLSTLSVVETARLPGIEPRRAPVILGGAIVAEQVLGVLDARDCLVSERDLLDGIVAALT